MAWTRRGRLTAALSVTFAVAALLVGLVLIVSGNAGVGPLAGSCSFQRDGGSPPLICPLSGIDPAGAVPNRPALAVKVENLPAARPQTGLSWAEVVYEEPVEAGITRFIAVYQCQDAGRVEPVRSARMVDPYILMQLGQPVFGYAGAVAQVVSRVRELRLVDVNFNVAKDAYHRDPARTAPHDLYTSTRELYAKARSKAGAPEPLFSYSTDRPRGKKVTEVHLPFSGYSDVYWRWSQDSEAFVRYHGDEPHTLSDGTPVSTENVVVQVVRVRPGEIVDVNGARSPEVSVVGSGKAYVFRNGRMVVGTWRRESLEDVTEFLDRSGDVVKLQPGSTWVELLPSNIPVSAS